jgi:hypothetical protein
VTETSGVWPDETDEMILAQVREVHEELDAPPADLTDRVLFTIAVAGLDAEIARRQDEQLVGSGARGTERTRTISFDADSLTIMVTAADMPDGRVRIDGWQHADASESPTVTADDAGRFVFPAVGHGLAQFVVHRRLGAGPESIVVTPAVTL